MRQAILSTCLGLGVLGCVAGLARGEGPVLSYAPMATPRTGGGPAAGVAHDRAVPDGAGHEALKQFNLPAGRICFNPAEAHDNIVSHKLAEPFQALRLGRWHGEALRARLCRWAPEKFVYEIAVLRRDGRILHVYMNARTGLNVEGQTEPSEPDDPQGD